MLDFILSLDTQLFLFLNGLHNSFFDTVMYWISHKFFWVPFYVFLVVLLYRFYGAKKGTVFTLLIVITFALTNTLSVEAFKNVFERPRPCHNELIQSQVHLVNNHCGGAWGFVSSHASNVFGLATLVFFFLKSRIKGIGWSIFLWASAISYSRIYLGVHYPLDILCGGLLGVVCAILVFQSAKQLKLINLNLMRQTT